MFKRIFLFLAMNLAVIVILNIVLLVLEAVFHFPIQQNYYLYIGIISIVIGFSGSFISLLLSKRMAKWAYKIEIVKGEYAYNLSEKEKIVWQIVEDLADRNHIKMPEVGFYTDKDPNAFATGATKNSSLVAVSTGLLEVMNKDAIEGVIGHEMSHILNGDMITMTLLQGVLNTFVVFFSRIIGNIVSQLVDEKLSYLVYILSSIILEIIFGIFASIIAMWFSRHREYRADEGSAKFVGKEKMIAGLRALQKMQGLTAVAVEKDSFASMKISDRKRSGIMSLFASHPDLEDRIANLEKMKY